MAAPPLPSFMFSIEHFQQSRAFTPRLDQQGNWLPPRPLGSNVPVPRSSRTHFIFTQGIAQAVTAAYFNSIDHVEYAKTSFYVDDGGLNPKLWIYPWDAVHHEVGDGTGNTRQDRGRAAEQNNGSSSDSEENKDGRAQEDWQPLTFQWNEATGTSHARFRGDKDRLCAVRQGQGALAQLLPDRYCPNQQFRYYPSNANMGHLTGDLAILIALVAYSVPASLAAQALATYLRWPYQPHSQPRGGGWQQSRRGMIVRIYYVPNSSGPLELNRLARGEHGSFVE